MERARGLHSPGGPFGACWPAASTYRTSRWVAVTKARALWRDPSAPRPCSVTAGVRAPSPVAVTSVEAHVGVATSALRIASPTRRTRGAPGAATDRAVGRASRPSARTLRAHAESVNIAVSPRRMLRGRRIAVCPPPALAGLRDTDWTQGAGLCRRASGDPRRRWEREARLRGPLTTASTCAGPVEQVSGPGVSRPASTPLLGGGRR